MKTITAHVVFCVQLVRNCIEIGIIRHCRVECIVKHNHLRGCWHQGVYSPKSFQVPCIVYRCKVAKTLYTVFHFLCYDATLFKQVATLHDTVTHCIYFVKAFDGSILRTEQGLKHEVHTFLMVGHIVHEFCLLAIGKCQLEESVVQSDAFHSALYQDRLVVHVVQLVFDGTTTAV